MSMTPTTEEAKTKGQSLDLCDLHAANIARQAEWCPDQVPDLPFRGNELGGECGEAQNVIKKLERERQGWRGSRATKDDLADELADVVICADLCAVTAGIDLGEAVRQKFNATSEKQGLSVFLPSPTLASTPNGTEAVSTARLEAAMDAFYPGEDWRADLGICLPSILRDMRAAIAASDAVLAAPRTDSTERTAGAPRAWPASYQETFDAIAAATKIQAGMISVSVRDFYRALAYPDRPSTPTPPAPPSVPDSVRALSEATAEFATVHDLEIHEGDDGATIARKFRASLAYAKAAAAEVATHPAGRSEDDAERCIACDKPLKAGDRVLPDAEGGTIHAACCGPERESYTKGDGEPLNSNDPIPQGYVYEPEYPAGQSAGQGAEEVDGVAVPLAWGRESIRDVIRARWDALCGQAQDEGLARAVPDIWTRRALCEQFADALAPNSTLTGPVDEAVTKAAEDAVQRLENAVGLLYCEADREEAVEIITEALWTSPLAVRPAAPEEQGARRDRVAKAEATLTAANSELDRLRAEVEAMKRALTEIATEAARGARRTFKASFRAQLVRIADTARAVPSVRPAAPEEQGARRSQAADDVLAERRRQVEVEGWTLEHDDAHSRCEMAAAAACYATAPSPIRIEREWTYPDAPANWPWCQSWWKPRFYRRNLVKAAALLIAEIERWDRLCAPPSSSQGGR